MNWKHIVCIEDLLRPKEVSGSLPAPLFTLIGEPIAQAVGQQVLFQPGIELPPMQSASAANFDKETFLQLAFANGQTSWTALYHALPEPAAEYLRTCIADDTLLLAMEMPAWLGAWCNKYHVDYIDLRISPLRFARDFYIALATNNARIYAALLAHGVLREEVALEAAAVRASISRQNWEFDSSAQFSVDLNNTLVYIGQTQQDAAIIGTDGKLLRCQDFALQLHQLSTRTWHKVLYKPHPYDQGFAAEERKMLESILGRPIGICFNNSYQLLGSPASLELTAISSGVLQEAEFFGKPAHWLHQPLVPLAWPEDEHQVSNYLQVHFENITAPAFWHQLLAPEHPAPNLSRLPVLTPNYGRELFDAWWDYSKFKIWQRGFWREAFERSGGNALRQRVATLEEKFCSQQTGEKSPRTIGQHHFSLHEGKRPAVCNYDERRADQHDRYEWADRKLPQDGFGLDFFCGDGYGTWYLSRTRNVWGIDKDAEAIRLAEEHHRSSRAFFSHASPLFEIPKACFDFAVSLQLNEPIANNDAFFPALAQSLKPGGLLVFSIPCEEPLPRTKLGDTLLCDPLHRDLEEAKRLIQTHQLELMDWVGQDVCSSPSSSPPALLQGEHGMQRPPEVTHQILMFCCRKIES